MRTGPPSTDRNWDNAFQSMDIDWSGSVNSTITLVYKTYREPIKTDIGMCLCARNIREEVLRGGGTEGKVVKAYKAGLNGLR